MAKMTPVREGSAVAFAGVLALLERRERVASINYAGERDRIRDDDRAAVPAMSAEEREEAEIELHRTSARWTEALEALAEVRALVRRL